LLFFHCCRQPKQGANALNPKTQLVRISLVENIIAHMTGSPAVAAVNPRTVNLWSCICLKQEFLTTNTPILCCTGIGTNIIYKKEFVGSLN
jgi:hypothetical protein